MTPPDVAEAGKAPSLMGPATRDGPSSLDLHHSSAPFASSRLLGSADAAADLQQPLLLIHAALGVAVLGGWTGVMCMRRHRPLALFKVFAFLPAALLLCASVASLVFFSAFSPLLREDGATRPFSGSPVPEADALLPPGAAAHGGADEDTTPSGFSSASVLYLVDAHWREFRRFAGAHFATIAAVSLLLQAGLALCRILVALSFFSCDSEPHGAAQQEPAAALPDVSGAGLGAASESSSAAGAASPAEKKKKDRKGKGRAKQRADGIPLQPGSAPSAAEKKTGAAPAAAKGAASCLAWQTFAEPVSRHWGSAADWRAKLVWKVSDLSVLALTVGLPLVFLVRGRRHRPSAFPEEDCSLPFASSSAEVASVWRPEAFASFLLLHPSWWQCLNTAALLPLQLLRGYPSVMLQSFEALWTFLLLLRHSLARDKTLVASPALAHEDFASRGFAAFSARTVPALGATDFCFIGLQVLQWLLLRPLSQRICEPLSSLAEGETEASATSRPVAALPSPWESASSVFSRWRRAGSAGRGAAASGAESARPSPRAATRVSGFSATSSTLVTPVPASSGGIQGLRHVGPPLFVDADGDEAHEFFFVSAQDVVTQVGTKAMRKADHLRIVAD
ncbi:hypothetical protein BESB_051560 [Besnoitia besnoiti]|uniref:Transmembrane protein n=1 Tax=Besnoitia besnoiti TaxID=94643 RepID=A0A2A9MC03_BESBE|nr:hypothetical protein BESB_051560 [Besnoitia besnoiti]PFH35505.1 hypothetical protein BESB_051560 [Besnoitia besnoiti]